ncbi:hypothetical protein [Dyella sp.]|uniref:hypothetical protein n=1 Tax=Dyella sp. TaxID=1869338 RepID=UPI002B459F2A|nr:hypothetical protein [Dyella sp.]HKT28103.1 hypothetical protein [Dyella sp.]
MAIVGLRQVNLFAPPADMEDQIGQALCHRSMAHFTQFLGQQALGFSYNSCNAAVAIAQNAAYDAVAVAGGFSVVYGSSRLYTGLDPDFNGVHVAAPGRPFSSSLLGEHAEQTAITVARAQGLAFLGHGGHYHIYVDLIPCGNCNAWLVADPDNWFVHYFAQLNNQAPVVNYKKRQRSHTFGRQMEPRLKLQKTK